MTKNERNKFLVDSGLDLFSLGTGGIGNWLSIDTDDRVFERLKSIKEDPLSKVQLNQLLAFGHEAPVSDGFFRYYWLDLPAEHPYNIRAIKKFEKDWFGKNAIKSIDHLYWGLYRLFIDGLLYYGNVRAAYRKLRDKTKTELESFFAPMRFDTDAIKSRGPALELPQIAQDDRYLISEMACKAYGDRPEDEGELLKLLIQAFEIHKQKGGGRIIIRDLLEIAFRENKNGRPQQTYLFSAEDVLDEEVGSVKEIREKYTRVADRFHGARRVALKNTEYYLSMVNDLDVYVATSMRSREDFRTMARDCANIFGHRDLAPLSLRYFDPTLSAAAGHEDKGLTECLMVKCAKALVYCAGRRDSYGKDAEAAMALNLGKPVIFYCSETERESFFQDTHPLSRLIHFETGVAVGAMVTAKLNEVSVLLSRIFENKMEYELEHNYKDEKKRGYIRLKENLTKSVVRLQTNNRMLTETFWNHYHTV